MINKPFQRWIAMLAVPVFVASTLAACQRSGEDTGAGSSAGTSGGGTTQSGGGKSSQRQGGDSESPGEKAPSR